MTNIKYKIVTYVPQDHIEQLRIAIANAGAGRIGDYDSCAFISSGIGVFKPLEGSRPQQGEIGKLERVGEARIEVTVSGDILKKAISAVKQVHPYGEPVIDVYKLEDQPV